MKSYMKPVLHYIELRVEERLAATCDGPGDCSKVLLHPVTGEPIDFNGNGTPDFWTLS